MKHNSGFVLGKNTGRADSVGEKDTSKADPSSEKTDAD